VNLPRHPRVAYLYLVRRMSRFTKVGLFLIPWWPLLLLVMIAREPSDFIIDDGPIDRTQLELHMFLNILFLPFAIGVIFLVIAGVRRIVRLRHRSA